MLIYNRMYNTVADSTRLHANVANRLTTSTTAVALDVISTAVV